MCILKCSATVSTVVPGMNQRAFTLTDLEEGGGAQCGVDAHDGSLVRPLPLEGWDHAYNKLHHNDYLELHVLVFS